MAQGNFWDLVDPRAIDQEPSCVRVKQPQVISLPSRLANRDEAATAGARSPFNPPHLGRTHLHDPSRRPLVLDPDVYAAVAPVEIGNTTSNAPRLDALKVRLRHVVTKQLMQAAVTTHPFPPAAAFRDSEERSPC